MQVLTKIAPGDYKMICKSKTTGKVLEKEYIFTAALCVFKCVLLTATNVNDI